MKKLYLPLFFLILAFPALGQGVRYDSNVTTSANNVPAGASAPILTLPNSIVTVCGYPATPTTGVCTNTVPIFNDQFLTVSAGNPIHSDSKGRFGFWVAPNLLSYSVQTQSGTYVGTWALSLSSIPGPAGPSGGFTQAGFLSAASYTPNFAAMMVDGSTANSTTTISYITPLPNGTTTVSADRDILALGGAQFTCPTGTCTLAFSGGDFDAPTDKQVFGTNVVVTGLMKARPEWFGASATVGTAIASLVSTGSDVYLQCATYRSGQDKNSPTDGTDINYMTKPNVFIHGCARPTYNAGYTQMVGGTIIQGGFYVRASGFKVEHVGFDEGSVVQAEFYVGWTALDGLLISGALPNDPTHYPNLTGIIIDDVNCLGMNTTSPDHCMLVEDVDSAVVHNVQTAYHEFGLVLKGSGSTLDTIYSRGHSNADILIKGDSYAPSTSDRMVNAVAASLVAAGDSGGIQIYASTGPNAGTSLSNISVDNTTYGLQILADTGASLQKLTVTNFTYDGESVKGACIQTLDTGGIEYLALSNLICNNVSYGYISNNPVSQQVVSNIAVTSATADAVYVGTATSVSNLSTLGVVGFDINNAGSGVVSVSNIVNATGANRFNGPVIVSDQTLSVAPITYTNGWHDYGSGNSAGSYSLNSTSVRLTGLMVYGGTNTVLTTLPIGSRPATTKRFIALGLSGSVYSPCEVVIDPTGLIAITNAATCGTTYMSLDGLSFSTQN